MRATAAGGIGIGAASGQPCSPQAYRDHLTTRPLFELRLLVAGRALLRPSNAAFLENLLCGGPPGAGLVTRGVERPKHGI